LPIRGAPGPEGDPLLQQVFFGRTAGPAVDEKFDCGMIRWTALAETERNR
jgi:hypothetical protein